MKHAEPSLLDLPLHGVRRIEASAGTGKTFTLALVHARLVIERGLNARQILAVTYTKAATQELRERLRKQLDRAARIVALPAAERTKILDGDDAAERLTTAVIERQLEREETAALTARLRRAANEIDLAAIFTIHAFCQRVLADHAVDSGEPLLPREMVGSERPLHEEVAFDAWRRWTRTREDTQDLRALWTTPAVFARDLPVLLRAGVVLPAAQPVGTDAESRFGDAANALRSAWQRDGATAQTDIAAARAAKILHGARPKTETLDRIWRALEAFAADVNLEAPDTDKLSSLTPEVLQKNANSGKQALVPSSPLFAAIEEFLAAQTRIAQQRARRRANLLHAILDYAHARLAELKRNRNLIGYDDLVGGVHAALEGPRGEALAQALREQYPAALVDEFQDTDAQQWQIFRRVYAGNGETTLFLIGDPKQAIYRFRGGDVHAYHAAASDVVTEHALAANFRSRPRVLAAIAALFAHGGEFPFADAATRFPIIEAGGRIADADFQTAGASMPALHVWRFPLRIGETTAVSGNAPHAQIKVDAARSLAANATAARIQSLLADARPTLRDGDTIRAVRPADIAVLVNTHREAERVQQALSECGVSSVTAGRSSLYATREAREILGLLEALHASGDPARLHAALATELLGMDATAIDAMSRDALVLQAWLDRFDVWRQRWQRFGPLALINEQVAAAASRLLGHADGERRLANYLQLAEHLQQARAETLGEAGLIDWLSRAIVNADEYDETQQLRLESSAERVQIMT
ncbi:MAG: UvrD-helicase domain-containing protein, partial [Dokdonella sp.]